MDKTITVKQLLHIENQFLQLGMPRNSHPSEDVIGNACCEQNCVVHIRRLDILMCRYHYVKFYNMLEKQHKRDARLIFLSSLKRIDGDKVSMISVDGTWPTCPTLFARTFGVSLSVLMNCFNDPTLSQYRSGEWYKTTIDLFSEALKIISEKVQINSLNEILIPPALSTQMPVKGARTVSVGELRRKINVPIRERKKDSLVRCSSCFGLRQIVEKSVTPAEKKEAKLRLRDHFQYISRQRLLIQTLCAQSREEMFDINVLLVDGMSNRHTKLPQFLDRPKFVTDSLRLPLSLTTVQLATIEGSNLFCNVDYPSFQTVQPHDSSYILSLFLDGITKLPTIPSVLILIMDSAPINKSYVILGGLGVILSKIPALQKIYVLYPCTGHTHLSCDAHFGNLSQSLRSEELLDTKDFIGFLNSHPSVAEVKTTPTIYEFGQIQEFMIKVGNLCSNSQFCLSKTSQGVIHWSTAPTMHSSLLFGAETDETAYELFSNQFQPKAFTANIRKPNIEQIKKKVEQLMNHCGELFSDTNRTNFSTFINNYGKKSFRQTITQINEKGRKMNIQVNPNDHDEDPHLTILKFLESKGYPTGRFPKPPQIVRVE